MFIKPSHKGMLHKALGVPSGNKIPLSKIENAIKNGSPTLKKQAVFAKNARSFAHK